MIGEVDQIVREADQTYGKVEQKCKEDDQMNKEVNQIVGEVDQRDGVRRIAAIKVSQKNGRGGLKPRL